MDRASTSKSASGGEYRQRQQDEGEGEGEGENQREGVPEPVQDVFGDPNLMYVFGLFAFLAWLREYMSISDCTC